MKQTVEEAAKEARMASAETLTTYGTHTSLDDFTYLSHDEIAEAAFIKGAEWQAKQAPWIKIGDREHPMQKDKRYLLLLEDGSIVDYDSDWEDKCLLVIAYMPIPSFDDVL